MFLQHLVAALHGTITVEALGVFNRIFAPLRNEDGWMKVTIVYDGDLASEEVMGRARRERIFLQSLEEYRGLIDFRAYSEWQLNRLKSDPIYRPSLYVEQRASVSVGREESPSKGALGEVLKLLDTDGARFVLVLGDFGTGKTFLLHEVARRLASEGRGRPIPVLIEMRALEKARALNALVAQHLSIAGMNQFNLAAFRYMLADGHIVLLFDGFDELALRVSYEKAIEHFDTLIEAAQGNAKVVVTSRGNALWVLKGHDQGVMSVAWSPHGMRLASGSEDGTVRLWDAWTGVALDTLSGCMTGAMGVAWSPDGATLAIGCGDGTIRLWDATTRSRVRQNPQGTMLASGTQHFTVLPTLRGTGPRRAPGGTIWRFLASRKK